MAVQHPCVPTHPPTHLPATPLPTSLPLPPTPQVLALVLVALVHLAYLRLCLPFRLRIELAAEMVASLCDLGVFICGIILITKPAWTASQRRSMGMAMLFMQVGGVFEAGGGSCG